MRTIKFRIWSEKFKRYFYTVDDFRKLYQSIDEDDEGLCYEEWWQPLISYYLLNTKSEIVYEDGSKYILEQFTGLYDKNGKEIWENDKVKLIDCNERKIYCSVEQITGAFSYVVQINQLTIGMWEYYNFANKSVEVIGNIHESDKHE